MAEASESTSVTVFHEKLEEALGDAEPMCLAMVKVETSQNDGPRSDGNEVGKAQASLDDIMAAVQTRISNQLRSYDLMARIEDDVFMLVVKTLADARILDSRMYQLYAILSEPYTVDGRDINVPVALGAAVRLPAEKAAALINRTEKALLAARAAGGKAPVLI